MRSPKDIKEVKDFFPQQIQGRLYELFALIMPVASKEKAYSDQTGRFTHRSTCGNEYLFTLYYYDSNAILQYTLKIMQGQEIVDASSTCHKRLTKYGRTIKLIILDNECSNDLRLVIF